MREIWAIHPPAMKRALLAVVLSAALCTMAGPSWSQSLEPRDRQVIAQELFKSLETYDDVELTAELLREAVRSTRRRCEKVTDYQIYLSQANRKVVKIKCPGRLTIGITVANNGFLQVYGGDGMIRSLQPDDGEIVTLEGGGFIGKSTESLPTANQTRTGIGGGPDEVDDSKPLPPWLLASVVFNIFIVGLVIGGAVLYWRSLTRNIPSEASEVDHGSKTTRLSSAQKDIMIDEADEVFPDVFQHPNGLYIARGRRGKRRVFPMLLAALMYRRYGFKLFEIRSQ